jgi:hypothetical protein
MIQIKANYCEISIYHGQREDTESYQKGKTNTHTSIKPA